MEGSMAENQPATVFEIMTRAPIICCKVNDLLKDVVYTMAQAEVNALLVVDEKNTTQGLISQSDILEHFTGIADALAEQVMSRELIWITPGETVEAASRLMVEKKAMRLLVADPERPGITAGIISASDIIRTLASEDRGLLPVKI
jgi:CBS domain-containing protein